MFDHDSAARLLDAIRPEEQQIDPESQARGHVPAEQVRQVFEALAAEDTLTARRDAALIALGVGAGLRRNELRSVVVDDLNDDRDTLVVRGKETGSAPCRSPQGFGER